MARLKSPLSRKLERALIRNFPPPSTVELEDREGIIGVITSARFAGIDSLERQEMIGDLIDSHLTPEEQRRVQIVVGVTPDEETFYSAIRQ